MELIRKPALHAWLTFKPNNRYLNEYFLKKLKFFA